MKQVFRSLSQGSILAYTLILLGIVLVASIGMFSASITNFRSVSSNDQSSSAFQIADSGSQIAVKMLRDTMEDKLSGMIGNCPGGQEAAIDVPSGFLGGGYRITFQGEDGSPLRCNDDVADVWSIKSVGSYGNTTRAVQVAVAAGGGSGITGGCRMSGTTISERWGVGCVAGPAASALCSAAQDSNSLCGLSGEFSGNSICICIAD